MANPTARGGFRKGKGGNRGRDKLRRLFPKKRPVCLCNDCGVDCAKIGEYYTASPKVWEETLGLGWADNLCIGCLERRLGRRMTMRDLCRWPNSPWEHSLRLAVRMIGNLITKRPPYRKLKSALNLHISCKDVEEIGKYRDAEPPLNPIGLGYSDKSHTKHDERQSSDERQIRAEGVKYG